LRMNRLRSALLPCLSLVLCLLSDSASAAFGETPYVAFQSATGAAAILEDGRAAALWLDARDYPGVIRAAHDVQADIERVTGTRPSLSTEARPQGEVLLIAGTIGKSRLIDELAASGKLDVSDVRGKWESFVVQVIDRPYAGVDRAVVIAG